MSQATTQGVVFPVTPDGSRSTTRTGAHILAAALGPVAPQRAHAALQEKHWRRTYPAYFRSLVEGSLASSEVAMQSANNGLDSAWQNLCWSTEGQSDISLNDALAKGQNRFTTQTITGRGHAYLAPWTVPLNGENLSGPTLRAKVADWLARGIMEPSAARALERCIDHPEWFDLSDRTLVLLGAGSEAGPFRWLMQWRASVVAVDIDRPEVWKRLVDTARAGNGVLHAPVSVDADTTADWVAHAGANLITQAPDIAAWLQTFRGPLDIASLAYLDGERHVKVAMGMDMIAKTLCDHDKRTTLAFLATPTDMFAVTRETAQASMEAYAARKMTKRTLQGSLHLATGDRFFQPNIEALRESDKGVQYGVVDSMVIEQGPNYALAKRLQQWRAQVARAAGHRVSLNVAPSTTTVSVLKNPALAAGFAGASSFGIEVFEPETTNALMAALWVHDLRCNESAANPSVPLNHPLELFMDNACHGGLWRLAYLPRSALPIAAALGWVRQRFN
ncbi:MAG: hypothetical protein H7Y28_08665 [Rhodoferax sp.]|nr:hypothetical protein [Rhodoferax sp.]